MPLQKQTLAINFAGGLDTKTDPFQVAPNRFLSLENTIFQKGGRLQKRNGYQELTPLPDSSNTYTTTFNDGLVAIGSHLYSYSSGSEQWVNRGTIQPMSLDTKPVARSSDNQTACDVVVASNGLACAVFTDVGSATSYKYCIIDNNTGATVVPPTTIPVSAGTISGNSRVFLLGNYFIIVITNVVTATDHLQYLAISLTNPTAISTEVDISTQYAKNASVAFDGFVVNNKLFLAWNGSDGGGAIRIASLTSTLVVSSSVAYAGEVCTMMSVCADITTTTPIIYAFYYTTVGPLGKVLAFDPDLNAVLAPTTVINAGTIKSLTSSAMGGVCYLFYEVDTAYSYDSGIKTDLIRKNTITQAGTVGTSAVMVRSLGLGSKSFIYNGAIYMLGAYSSTNQPSYFLVNTSGSVLSKLAYQNGGGYRQAGLPNVTVSDTTASIGYLFKVLVESVNKTQGLTAPNGVYSQTGVNLAEFTFTETIVSSEIGSNLNLSGGIVWAFDGAMPVEQNFNIYPENVEVTVSHSGGSMTVQDYFYQVVYEWTDAQGNIHRSAPSIPVKASSGDFSGSSNSVTVNIPTLRLSYKTNVKLVVYRWSTAQQSYYQTTSITSPTLNNPAVDSVAFVDTNADASILGNSLIYTTGGVIENIGPPAASILTIFKSRLFLVDAEDQNLLWYSKTVIEGTPVEMSDLFTLFVAPTISAQGSTGSITALAAMDDKLIIFKHNAIYYLVGTGPDITGTNNDFSDPVFITSTVGCMNENSIVFVPQGLMFQSDKGIWLLGRDLSTQYIGAPVEDFNSFTVESAVNIPETNQVRFTLSNGVTLMYDYFYGQWGTFTGIPAISSTIYGGLHTYINSFGQVFQETPLVFLDGSNPISMSFLTAWLKLGGIQNYERAYFFFLLGEFISPHLLKVTVSFDYNSNPVQTCLLTPMNLTPAYGDDPIYGDGIPYGGTQKLEEFRVFFQRQKCEAIQIGIKETSWAGDSMSGAGLTLSGLNVIIGAKDNKPKLTAAESTS